MPPITERAQHAQLVGDPLYAAALIDHGGPPPSLDHPIEGYPVGAFTVPLLVGEYGIGTSDDSQRAACL